MSDELRKLPATQANYLRALQDGRYRSSVSSFRPPRATSLVDRMPPIYQQALRGTCVSNAVTALVEYRDDCKLRLSVQFLFAATKAIERQAVERNLAHVRTGEPLDPPFEIVYHATILQLRMLADANGGMASPAVRPYLERFEETVRTRHSQAEGSLLRSCFRALETIGICRYALWPYAAARSDGLFGAREETVFPPGSREDALKHRVTTGLYLLGAPNNVDEIRSFLAGQNGRRPMPVVVTLHFFKDCDGEVFAFPRTREDADGDLVTLDAWQGVHGVLLVGYRDDASVPGGGHFIFRNSLGEGWGNRGYGKIPYAYVECFAVEAGTILQDMVDYEGDGYDGLRKKPRKMSLWMRVLVNLLIALAVAAATIAIGICFDDPLHLRRPAPAPVETK